MSESSSGKTGPEARGTGATLVRRIVAATLVVLTAVMASAAVPAVHLRAEVLTTDRLVAAVAPLASDPAIQAEIANKVTSQIAEAMDLDGITRDAMAELGKTVPRAEGVITGLAPAIAVQTRSLIHAAVSTFVAGPQFRELWVQLNRVTHQGLVGLATGQPDGIVNLDEGGTLSVSTREIISRTKVLLVEQGVDLAARIPEVDGRITLLQSPELVNVTEAIRVLDRAAPVLAWLTLLSALGALAVAPRGWRRRTTNRVGLGIAAAMALLALGLTIGRDIFLSRIPSTTLSPAAAESLLDALLTPLRSSVRLVFVVALLVAVSAFLGGRSRTAGLIRQAFARSGDYLTGKIGAGPAKPWQRRLVRHRRPLEAAVAGAAALVLVFWQFPTAAAAIWTAAGAGLAVLVVELLCRPAVAAGISATAGDTGAPENPTNRS